MLEGDFNASLEKETPTLRTLPNQTCLLHSTPYHTKFRFRSFGQTEKEDLEFFPISFSLFRLVCQGGGGGGGEEEKILGAVFPRNYEPFNSPPPPPFFAEAIQS